MAEEGRTVSKCVRGARSFRCVAAAGCARHGFRYRVSGAVGLAKEKFVFEWDWNRRHRIASSAKLSRANKASRNRQNVDLTLA